MTKAQMAEIRAAVDLGFSLAEARELVLGAPVTAESPVAEATIRSKDGRDFACTASPSCSRKLRSKTRAASHGVEAGGHVAR